jgi:ubiquinone/menaquinone biosynthesis C-methylase UbiE
VREHKVEAYWSRFAHSYDRDGEYVVGRPILQAIEKRLLQECCLGEVAEFGCGTGYWTRVIAGSAQRVIATDLSDDMLEIAQDQLRGFQNVKIQKADCARAPLPQEGFDSVLMANLLHVIDRPLRCLQEGYRILREGGVLIAIDFTGYGMRAFQKVRLGLRYLAKWGLPPRQGRDDMTPDELAILVESAGFKVQNVRLIEAGSNALYLRGQKGLG